MAIKTYNDQNFVAIANAIRSKNGETTQYKPSEMAAAISAIESAIEVLPQDTVSGALANFPDGSDGYPVVELIANIEPKQAGSGDPAPDNVRPISGSSSVVISVADENNIVQSTKTIDLGRTVYGGTLNVTTGVLTVTQKLFVYNADNIPTMSLGGMAAALGDKKRIFINQPGISRGQGQSNIDNVYCDKYKTISAVTQYTGVEGIAVRDSATTGFYIYDEDIQTVAAWQNEIRTNGLTIAWDIATPEVYQLEPEEVKTLLGVNNIYADTGNVSVTYRADVDLYIAKKIAEGA